MLLKLKNYIMLLKLLNVKSTYVGMFQRRITAYTWST